MFVRALTHRINCFNPIRMFSLATRTPVQVRVNTQQIATDNDLLREQLS